MITNFMIVCPVIFLVALVYSAVGQAGASGYIAALTFFGYGPAFIKPTVLMLNILVACIGAYQFWRGGHFSWKLFWPFAVLSVPFAFIGGYLLVPAHIFRLIVGSVLLMSAARLFVWRSEPQSVQMPNLSVSLPTGAGIGFLSGITATGGGIFLTPLMIFFRWAHTKPAAAVSAVFILVNSVSALLGHVGSHQRVPTFAWPLAVAAVIGGAIGSRLGSRHLPVHLIHISLATVLIIAGLKLIFT
jgi:uncharacterized membrane protein YfcA